MKQISGHALAPRALQMNFTNDQISAWEQQTAVSAWKDEWDQYSARRLGEGSWRIRTN